MATVTFNHEPAHTVGELPEVGQKLPDFDLVGTDLSAITPADFSGKKLVLNVFPSLDTNVCALSVKTFNEKATGDDDTVVINISHDLPFAQDRFVEDNDISTVAASAFRASFGQDYGLTLTDSPLAGLLSRAVVVTDADHTVVYTELVDEITTEPNYDAALAALS